MITSYSYLVRYALAETASILCCCNIAEAFFRLPKWKKAPNPTEMIKKIMGTRMPAIREGLHAECDGAVYGGGCDGYSSGSCDGGAGSGKVGNGRGGGGPSGGS